MKVLVVDGAGGSIGQQIILRLNQSFGNSIEILALGTNAVAASNMMKAGANRGASGENSFRVVAPEADIIIGPLSIVVPNSFLGELTPAIAEYIAASKAKKILLPLGHQISVVGTNNVPLPHLMDETINLVRDLLAANKNV